MFKLDRFPDPRPRYTDQISVIAPPGTREALKRAAAAQGVTVPDLLRRALKGVASEAALAAIPADRVA